MIVTIFAIVALAAPLLAPPEGDDPYDIPRDGLAGGPEPPSDEHPLGLMQDRYDMLYGIIWGTRVAFRIGVLITLGRLLLGVPLGLISAYYGGWVDALLMRITDAFLSFPIVAAVLIFLTVNLDAWGVRLGKGDRAIVAALILFGWMQYARLIRGNVLVERAKDYVRAAVSIGVSNRRLIMRHILPNATQGLFVMAASDIGAMVITVAALTFIGFLGEQPSADWGMILKSGRNWIVGTPSNAFEYWYTYIPPILAIVLFSIGWNLIGDGLRDTFDPRMRGRR
jgi:peptide/nickel transport system permease protein